MTDLPQPAVAASPSDRAAVPDWGPTLFVGGVWALLFGAALLFARAYAIDVPWWDDWYVWVTLLTGEAKVTPYWLWEAYEEHRAPFQKLIWVALFTLTGGDSRVGVYFDVLALAGLSLAMLRVARDLRGWTAYADAFFPLLLMHCGQCYAYVVGWGLSNTLPAVMVGLVLVLLLRYGDRLTRAGVVQLGSLYAVLPLCGPQGLVYVPPLAVWFAYAGWRLWNSGKPADRRNALWLAGFLVVALTFTLLYFLDMKKSSHPPSWGPEVVVLIALDLAGLGFGIASGTLRLPYRAVHDYLTIEFSVLGLVTLVLSLLSVGVLLWMVRREPTQRGRALALLLFLGGGALLLGGFGLARSGWNYTLHSEGFAPIHLTAYGVLVAPLVCCLYFVCLLWRRPVLSPFLCTCLFTLTGVVFALNCQEGRTMAQKRAAGLAAYAKVLEEAPPPYVLLASYSRLVEGTAGLQDEWGMKMRLLKAAGVGPYRHVPDDPEFQELAVPLQPVQIGGIVWTEDAASGTYNSFLDYALEQPQFVAGIRVTFTLTHTSPQPTATGNITLGWRNSAEAEFKPQGQFNQPRARLDERQTYTIWIAETIDQIRIFPSAEPFHFQILELTMLLPVEAAAP